MAVECRRSSVTAADNETIAVSGLTLTHYHTILSPPVSSITRFELVVTSPQRTYVLIVTRRVLIKTSFNPRGSLFSSKSVDTFDGREGERERDIDRKKLANTIQRQGRSILLVTRHDHRQRIRRWVD